jgi:hypothetical protein
MYMQISFKSRDNCSEFLNISFEPPVMTISLYLSLTPNNQLATFDYIMLYFILISLYLQKKKLLHLNSFTHLSSITSNNKFTTCCFFIAFSLITAGLAGDADAQTPGAFETSYHWFQNTQDSTGSNVLLFVLAGLRGTAADLTHKTLNRPLFTVSNTKTVLLTFFQAVNGKKRY